MPVTVANVIIGPCTAFKVDNVDVGATASGVQVQVQDKYQDVEVDQIPGVVAKGLTQRTMTVKTQLAEATLENLQVVWNLGGTITTDGTTGAKTLGIGVDRKGIEHALTFIGPGPNGTLRTFTVHRAVSVAAASYDMAKDKPAFLEVTFECMPDLAKQSGQEFATISEAAAV